MYTIDFGLFPFAALILGGCLYAIYYWGIRLKCKARWAQTFIVIAMLLVTLSMFVNPTKIVQQKQLSTISGVSSNLQSENNKTDDEKTVTTNDVPDCLCGKCCKDHRAAGIGESPTVSSRQGVEAGSEGPWHSACQPFTGSSEYLYI